jgi:CheY-like chemotaxis protein
MQNSSSALRILVAEDSPANQKIAIRLLEKRGHQVYLAENGREALAILAQAPIDLILMDVHMPEMDGVQATIEIRKCLDDAIALVPIVAVSAHNSREDQERCLAAGMDAFLAKPIDMQQLVELVERLAASRTSCDEGGEPTPEADFSTVLAQVGGDRRAFLDFTRVFWNDSASWLDRARAAADDKRLDELSVAAGCLESLARSVSSGHAARLALQLRAKALGGDWLGSLTALEKLQRHITALRSLLAHFCASLQADSVDQAATR